MFGTTNRSNQAGYFVDSQEGVWNRGKQDPTNLGYQIRLKEGYFPCPPWTQAPISDQKWLM